MKLNRLATVAVLLCALATPSFAHEPASGPLGRLKGWIRHRSVTPSPAATAAPYTSSVSETTNSESASGSDPYGFADILNRIRAGAGLHPLVYDSELSSWASQNNAAQCQRGIGHHVHLCGVQNCGWNYGDAGSVAQGWMDSPGHRQNLLSPSVSRYGLAFGPGPYWTFNAR